MRSTGQKSHLRILLVEDSSNDIELTHHHLRRLGIGCELVPVQTQQELETELERTPDLILSDTNVTQLDGLSALDIATKKCPKIPFVILSGTLREETRAVALSRGAAACVLKDDPEKLVAVIRVLFGLQA